MSTARGFYYKMIFFIPADDNKNTQSYIPFVLIHWDNSTNGRQFENGILKFNFERKFVYAGSNFSLPFP